MAIHVGKGHIHSLDGGTIAVTGGTVSPNMQSIRLTHGSDIQRIRAQGGDTGAVIGSDEVLELEIDFIPQGSSIANAKTSAKLPTAPSIVTLSGLHVIAVGSFSDALNGTNFIYEGGGTITGEAGPGPFTMTMPLRRYAGMASPSIIT